MSVVAPAQRWERARARGRTWLIWGGCALSPVLLFSWLNSGDPTNWPFGLRVLVPVMVMALPAWALRRQPIAALAVLLLNVALVELVPPMTVERDPGFHGMLRTVQTIALDVAVGYLAVRYRRLASVSIAVLVLAVQVTVAVAVQLSETDLNDRVIHDALAMLSAWVIGNTVRQRRQFSEAQRVEAAAKAVQAERLRIARELHDMIAHCIGVVAMQAGMARRVLDTQPDEARTALTAIEDTARDTLGSLRRMLTSLRRVDPAGAAPRESAPGLTDLARLAERSRSLGVQVEVQSRGVDRPLPPDIDMSAYRIIQEAVTNVVRHASAHRCEVVVDRGPAELSIQVTDDGRGGAVGAGYGIAGMRERVSLLGGEFTAGPRAEGGFEVAARIPLVVVR